MRFIIKKDGFSLLEILVALLIGSIITIGLFELFNTVMDTRSYALKKGNSIESVSKIISLFDSDIRCKIGKFQITRAYGVNKLSFTTSRSLFFSGSVPVTVSYYIDKVNGKNILFRDEENIKAKESLTIPLTDIFNKIEFKFYSNGEWVDEPSQIISISLFSKGKKYTFCQRGMVER